MLVVDPIVQDSGLLGAAPALVRALNQARRSARSPHPVLIVGETGTGKELLAKLIHDESSKAGGPFSRLGCAAITDIAASAQRASAGTLFLDEVSELSTQTQAKLLHVLESPQGSCPSDARILAATHRDLRAECAAGRFRWDLYFRLEVLTVQLPPLRDRGEDVLHIARHILGDLGARDLQLDADAERALLEYGWPGNVRELRNVLLRATTYASGPKLSHCDLALPRAPSPANRSQLAGRRLEDLEREAILQTLDQTPSQEAAARLLGVSSRTLRNKLTRYRAQGHVE